MPATNQDQDNPYAAPRSLPEPGPESAPSTLKLSVIFGLLYFVQGISEPSKGPVHQPAQDLLETWGYSAQQVGFFFTLLGAPWFFKPLFGWISDFLPLAGYRRKSYLMLTTATASLGFGVLAMQPWGSQPHYQLLLVMLMLPAVGMAFSDVVIDGLMVETSQPLGLTGRLQSVQWTALYAASFIMSAVAGILTRDKHYQLVMAICAAGPAVACLVTILYVRETPLRGKRPGEHFRGSLQDFVSAARSPLVICVGGFLLLWNFNPFTDTIQQLHVTKILNLGQGFYGFMESTYAVAAATGCLLYSLYCRHIRMTKLIHLSIVLGIFSTLSYWFMRGEASAVAVSAAAGFAAATATMIQLDLAARIVPAAVAGTVFALLMSLANLGSGLSPGVGGSIYDWIEPTRGPFTAYNLLVAVGASCTACCWFLVPGLRRLVQQTGPVKPGTLDPPPFPPAAG